MSTAFAWRHKILDTLSELTEKTYLTGVVEADETFFNVSFKGNHKRSQDLSVMGSASLCPDHEIRISYFPTSFPACRRMGAVQNRTMFFATRR
jgi:hypothetical protein